ncbi:hypothetical protein PMAYCL1PPCAC_15741, partial [Pristionchus mayeri]
FQMRGFILFSILACSAAHQDSSNQSGFRSGPGHRPDFFDLISQGAREEFVDIMFDQEKSRAQILEDELDWGRANGIEKEVREHQTARTSFWTEHHNKVDEAVKMLPEALVKMRSYFRDHSLSHDERSKALHRLFKAMTPELRALVQSTRSHNMEKLAKSETFPAHKRRKAIRENLLKDNNAL